MHVWLDDRRDPPDATWRHVRTPEEAISLLEKGAVDVVSLDHDLGVVRGGREMTGYDVLVWIEERVVVHGIEPPEIRVHSANPPGRDRLLRGAEAIERAWQQVAEGNSR